MSCVERQRQRQGEGREPRMSGSPVLRALRRDVMVVVWSEVHGFGGVSAVRGVV